MTCCGAALRRSDEAEAPFSATVCVQSFIEQNSFCCELCSKMVFQRGILWVSNGFSKPLDPKVTSCISFCSKSISVWNTLGIQRVFQTFGFKCYIMYFILFKKYFSVEYFGYPTGIPDLYIQKLHHVFILFQNNSLAWNTLCIPWVFQTLASKNYLMYSQCDFQSGKPLENFVYFSDIKFWRFH